MKKILSLILTLSMLLSMCAFAMPAAEVVETSDEITDAAASESKETATLMGEDGYVTVFEQDFEGMTAQTATNVLAPASTIDPYKSTNTGYAPLVNKTVTGWYNPSAESAFTFVDDTVNKNKYLKCAGKNWQYMGISFTDANYGLVEPGDYRLSFDIVCDGRVVSNPAWNSNSYPYSTTKPDYFTFTSTDVSSTLKPNGKRTTVSWTIREEDVEGTSPARFAARLAFQFNAGASSTFFGVDNIKLEYKAPAIKAVEVSGIDAPETNLAPDMTAVLPTGANYTVKSITWTPEVTDVFASPVAYTAKVVLTPNANHEFATAVTAKFNNETVPATVDANGDVVISYTFPETIYKEAITVTITSGTTISSEGGTIDLAATVATVNPNATIPNYGVVWTIDNEKLAILEGTTLKALRNGQLTVTATSIYDASVSAEVVVNISNQTPDKTIKFDKGTLADVGNMPEDIVDKGHIVLPYEKPTREGFVFGGWSTEKYNYDAVITELDLNKDITLYATWYKGGLVVDYDTTTDKLPSNISDVTYGPSYVQFKSAGSPQISWDGDWVLDASKYTMLEVRLASSNTTGNEELVTYFASKDREGNVISGTWSGGPAQNQAQYSATIKRTYFTGKGADTFQSIFTDMTTDQKGVFRNTWRDNIINFRLDITKRSAGHTIKLDYIRFVNPVVEEVAITGIDIPEARQEADTDAVAVDSTKYKVVDVSWEETLLYDYYFNGGIAYTVNVTLDSQKGYALSSKPYVTINGQEAYVKKYNDDGTVVVAYTFAKTESITPEQAIASKITLVEEDNDGQVLNERMVFSDLSIRLDTNAPLSKPDNKRWMGWTTVKDDASTMITSVTGATDRTLYALYEAYDNFDFSDKRHQGDISTGEFGTLKFDGNNAVVVPAANSDDTYIKTVPTLVKAADYGKVEVIYDGRIYGVYKNETFTNRFTPTFKPALYFSDAENANTLDTNNMATLVGGERITIDGTVCYKYTYDVSCHDNWTGTIGRLFIDPYDGFPEWGVRSIKLIKNDPTSETVEITGIATPTTWGAPTLSAAVQSTYNVVAVEWSPELNEQGAFKADTSYTVTVKVKPNAGLKFAQGTLATIDGEEAVVEIDESANILSASYTYTETLPLVPVTVEIEGNDAIVREGRYETYKATVVGETYIPNTDVVWTVRNAEDADDVTTSDRAYFANGRLYPTLNGDVILTATSVYDPTVKAELEIAISGQTVKNKVTFDKNTTKDVTNMPDPVFVKGVYAPDVQAPVREGFAFLGWSLDPDAYEATKSYTISEDTTLYAIWTKGYSFEFNSEADLEGFVFSNMGTPVIEDGCLVFTPTSTDPIMEKNVSFNLDDYKNVDVRFSAEAGSHFQVFFKTANATSFNETNSNRTYYSKTNGSFIDVRVQMGNVAAWTGMITQVRLDPCNTLNNKMRIDYVRFVDDNRMVTFNANGGEMMVSGEAQTEYMTAVTMGDLVPPVTPYRAGYKFMGWANNPGGTGRLYNGSVPVTDDRTFYATWNLAPALKDLSEEEAQMLVTSDNEEETQNITVTSSELGIKISSGDAVVTPVVKIADTMNVTDSSKKLLLKYSYNYKSMTQDALMIRFKNTQDGEYKYTIIKDNSPIRASLDYISFDLSQNPDWTGDIYDVALVLPTGVVKDYSISELTLTSEEIADGIINEYNTADKAGSSEETDDSGARKEYEVATQPERPQTPAVTDEDPAKVTKFTTLTSGEGTITIGFDSDVSKEVIATVSGFKNNGFVDGILKLEADGTGENSIATVDGLAVDAKTHRYIAIKADADLDKGAKVKVYFKTDKDDEFIEANSVTSEITGQNSIATFDMGKLSGWSGTVTQVKFVFEGGAKGTVDVDYIMFANAAPSNPAVEEKLETKFKETTTNIPDFVDVADAAWYNADVDKAVALGFMKGRNDTTFDPNGDVSVAEIITVAARAHAIYFGKELNETAAAGEKWYAPFVKYAIENNIIANGQYADYEMAATRYQVATIIVKAVDKTWLKEINAFTQVPDVLSTLPGYMDILALYKAGVVIGVDAQFNYLPENTIKRCEIAAIINRLALPESRKTVEVK